MAIALPHAVRVGLARGQAASSRFCLSDVGELSNMPRELGDYAAVASADPQSKQEKIVSNSNDLNFTLLEVKLHGVTHTLHWDRDMALVDTLLQEGLDVPYSCRVGKCSACVCVISSGAVVMENNEALDERDLAEGYVLGCQARPTTPEVKVEF